VDPAGARLLAVGLLAAVLAVGTALPQLGTGGPGFPAPSEREVATPVGERTAGRVVGPTMARAKPLPASPVDLNMADGEGLQALPGIGPALAQRILAYREVHGPFRTPEELLQVPGIGLKRWERIRHAIRVVGEGP
jgi:competence protein ComEA